MGKGGVRKQATDGGEAEGVRIAYRVALDIAVPVQAPAVADAAPYHILVHEALDFRVIVALPHVVEAVGVGADTAAAVVEISGKGAVPAQQLPVGAIGIGCLHGSRTIRQLHGAAQMVIVVVQYGTAALLADETRAVEVEGTFAASFLFSLDHYQNWCKRKKYNFSQSKAEEIYGKAKELVPVLPKDDITKLIIKQAVDQLNSASTTIESLRTLMNETASKLPEYPIVMAMKGVGPSLGPQLMAEIGDVSRFTHKGAITAFAGVDPGVNESGTYEQKSVPTSKRGSSDLRKHFFR